ncbi:translation initiation factor eIF-1A [Natronorarus salvus]|uniref:translation initiation factor eIF-1A n=1 Tax=Natronorarus salvus TaxID=3117733 RepID=UPI002F266DBA
MSEESPSTELRLPTDTQQFALVTEIRDGGHARLRCADRIERTGKVPVRLRNRVWIREGDLVLVEPWGWESEKAEIVWRYTDRNAERLRSDGHVSL